MDSEAGVVSRRNAALGCLGAFMPSVCLFGKRPEVLFETSCSGSIVHSRCLYGHRLKAIIMQGL